MSKSTSMRTKVVTYLASAGLWEFNIIKLQVHVKSPLQTWGLKDVWFRHEVSLETHDILVIKQHLIRQEISFKLSQRHKLNWLGLAGIKDRNFA